MKAYHHTEDGQVWLRIFNDYAEWDEPIKGWEIVCDLVRGTHYYRNKENGREIPSA